MENDGKEENGASKEKMPARVETCDQAKKRAMFTVTKDDRLGMSSSVRNKFFFN